MVLAFSMQAAVENDVAGEFRKNPAMMSDEVNRDCFGLNVWKPAAITVFLGQGHCR